MTTTVAAAAAKKSKQAQELGSGEDQWSKERVKDSNG
jgi:hypothetical protein